MQKICKACETNCRYTLYFTFRISQMRAHTEYRGGGWSESVLISHGSILGPGESCSDDDSIVTVPIISVVIAIGAVLATILLICLCIVVVVCSKICRRKTKLKHILTKQVG